MPESRQPDGDVFTFLFYGSLLFGFLMGISVAWLLGITSLSVVCK